MTKKEAIYILRNAAWLGSNEERQKVEEAVEVVAKAIEALNHSEIPNSSDTIYRQDVIELVKNSYYNLAESMEDTWAMVADVERLPPAQPEIIRCKNCKYYIPYEWMFDGLSRSSNRNDYASDEIGCAVNDHNYPPEGFCSYAERRTNECTD